MARLPGTGSAVALVRGAVEVLGQARETVAAVHRAALRIDRVTAELEAPLRALVPGLERLAVVLEDPAVADLPATLRQVQTDVLPVLRTLADTHERVAALGALPGAGLLGLRWPAARPVVLPDDPV